MTAARPPALARAAVALAGVALPTAEDRARYRAEFGAELYDLPPGQQLRHSAGLLSRSFALRAALGASPSRSTEDAMTRSITPSWRCRMLGWHTWVLRSAEDGGLFHLCARCGLDRGPVGYGPMTTPPYRDS
jgi:hypothetical protein